jgi:hypothetical protein
VTISKAVGDNTAGLNDAVRWKESITFVSSPCRDLLPCLLLCLLPLKFDLLLLFETLKVDTGIL